MMRSLWAGVSGLSAHQTAMDVEGNNIANVNTTGFKYSRTNFSDMLSQTAKIATAPQDTLGGKNSMQVGLGATVDTVTHIFTQGSRQSTGVNTDIAIEGEGFFVVSPDGGSTYRYTRDGEFNFDAYGNFVDSNGYTVQGWIADSKYKVDSTGPVKSIQIEPGLTIPAKTTENITLKANLARGSTTNTYSSIYQLDSDSATTTVDSTSAAGDPSVDSTVTTRFQVSEDFGALFNANGKAYNLQNGQGIWVSFENTVMDSATTAGLSTGAVATGVPGAAQTVSMVLNGVTISGSIGNTTSTNADNATSLAALINQFTTQTGVAASASGTAIKFTNTNQTAGDSTKNLSLTINAAGGAGLLNAGTYNQVTAYKYQYSSTDVDSSSAPAGSNKTFHDTEDLRKALQLQAQATSTGALVSINSDGKFTIKNPTGTAMNIATTSIKSSTVTENALFASTFTAFDGNLAVGSSVSKTTQAINAATHGASIDVYDSLGSKHTVTIQFRKYSENEWTWQATVPQPADVGGMSPNQNVFKGGTVTFNSDGSLASVTPTSLAVDWKNGATSQQITLNFGTANALDGLTSFDQKSATGLISQDGYASGEQNGVNIDANGYIIGSFTNGKQLTLGQIAMAKFTNNAGLLSEGGNTFSASSNSGDPTIGTAAAGGRGALYSGALEMSNVDLSKSLTNLIVIQRGYQANSKTITTSDQLLQTLLSIKQ